MTDNNSNAGVGSMVWQIAQNIVIMTRTMMMMKMKLNMMLVLAITKLKIFKTCRPKAPKKVSKSVLKKIPRNPWQCKGLNTFRFLFSWYFFFPLFFGIWITQCQLVKQNCLLWLTSAQLLVFSKCLSTRGTYLWVKL